MKIERRLRQKRWPSFRELDKSISYQVLKSPIRLAREEHKSRWEWTKHWLIEVGVFYRKQSIKNNFRGNSLLVSSFWTVTIFCLMSFFLVFILNKLLTVFPVEDRAIASLTLEVRKLQGDVIGSSLLNELRIFTQNALKTISLNANMANSVLGYFGAVSIIYWNRSNVFRGQWQYCAGIYNVYIQSDQQIERLLLRNALALDLLVTDLWAHRSFRDVFAAEVECATFAVFSSNSGAKEAFFEKISDGKATETEILKLLERHQEFLIGRRTDAEENKLKDAGTSSERLVKYNLMLLEYGARLSSFSEEIVKLEVAFQRHDNYFKNLDLAVRTGQANKSDGDSGGFDEFARRYMERNTSEDHESY